MCVKMISLCMPCVKHRLKAMLAAVHGAAPNTAYRSGMDLKQRLKHWRQQNVKPLRNAVQCVHTDSSCCQNSRAWLMSISARYTAGLSRAIHTVKLTAPCIHVFCSWLQTTLARWHSKYDIVRVQSASVLEGCVREVV